MAWWRRDPSLGPGSLIHRYAQRVLRDHEAALRTRCFSRTPSKAAQHDDNSPRRPDGMTDLEWAQVQHYWKWRKRLQEHPYKALFGASEDMLRGKGLTDWEWVYKTFPKWMLREMDPQEWTEQNRNSKSDDHGRKYGKRTEVKDQAKEQSPVERAPTFAEPIIKTTHYERDEFGIVSPSDLRRPQEHPHVKVVGKHQERTVPSSNETASRRLEDQVSSSEASKPELGQQKATSTQPSESFTKIGDNTTEASSRESSFIDAFFADESKVCDRDLGNSKSWRQTALQRRSASNVIARPTATSSLIANTEAQVTSITPAQEQETILIPSSQASADNFPYPKSSSFTAVSTSMEKEPRKSHKEVGWSVPELAPVTPDVCAPEPSSVLKRSTSAILDGLPKDDIDFLSAADIRAAMGTKKNAIQSSEDRKQARQKLEQVYMAAQPKALDEVVEAHVVNNYHVRRTQQELDRAQATSKERMDTEQTSSKSSSELPQMESSIDRMRRWIEEGGASISKHFWQDPIEAGAPSENDLQFAKQMAGLGKGRRAREHISDDLETDLPMCKGLLERLKNDENRVENAVYLLRSPRKVIPGAEISNNFRTIRERRLRNTYERTEKQFESACQALRALQDTEAIVKATNAFKRRLGIASKILHKNATLTRMLTWSAQARLDEPDLERSKAELYSEILTRLATLRDTQLALARLMDHAIQIYRVTPTAADEALSRPVLENADATTEVAAEANASTAQFDKKASAKPLVETAAISALADEIQSQKATMEGLSDDGYIRAPKQTPRRPFEEKNPLAHSLFRPFTLQIESLGNKTEGEVASEKLKDAFKQKMGDKKLVQEVRSAYEDVYGPITVEHRQVPQTEETESPEDRKTEASKVLKEDPVSSTATVAEGIKPPRTAPASEPLVTETKPEQAQRSLDTASSSSMSEAIDMEASTVTPAAVEPLVTISESNPSPTEGTSSSPSATTAETTVQDTPAVNLPTHYTILVHDPQTDTLSITTSTSRPPRDTSPALPIHQALSSLKAPEKFIPYITSGLEVATAKTHMLILRDALDETSSTRGFETISAPASAEQSTERFRSEVNPIDGTTRLSPTGYSGVEESQEQLERDFEERRQAAAATEEARRNKSKQEERAEIAPKKKRGSVASVAKTGPEKKRGSVGSVVKTVIWATTACYVFGVIAEVLR